MLSPSTAQPGPFQPRPRADRWGALPAEIRTEILTKLAAAPHDGLKQKRKRDENVRRWCYPAVCLEWQAFFERRNFHRLTFGPAEFSNLGGNGSISRSAIMRGRRREYITHIGLQVRLPVYDCRYCHSDEGQRIREQNWRVFLDAIT